MFTWNLMDGGTVRLGSLDANAVGSGQTETVASVTASIAASIGASITASVIAVWLAEGNARQKKQCLSGGMVSSSGNKTAQ